MNRAFEWNATGSGLAAVAGAAVPQLPVESRVEQIQAYWESKRQGRPVPRRCDIDPAAIRTLLPYLAISEVHHDPFRVRYRLGGEAVNEALGFNIAKRWLHEMKVTGGHEAWLEVYRRCVATQRPVRGRSRGSLGAAEVYRCDWALFPLGDDGAEVTQFLEIEDWKIGSAAVGFSDKNIVWRLEVDA